MHDKERKRECESLRVTKNDRQFLSQIKLPEQSHSSLSWVQWPFGGDRLYLWIWFLRTKSFDYMQDPRWESYPASAGKKRSRIRVGPAWHRLGRHSRFTPFLVECTQQGHPSSPPHAFSLWLSSLCKHPFCLCHICWDQWEAYRNKRKNLDLQSRHAFLSASQTLNTF